MLRFWYRTACTANVIGISTLCFSARATIDLQVDQPSTTEFVESRACLGDLPFAIASPKLRFLPLGEMHVVTRSPSPERPANVCSSAPILVPRRVISVRPLASRAAFALSPALRPSSTPAAIAMTFFIAPASSTPSMSGFV